jgi:2-methylcitrate dehydratase PrpD
MTTALQPTAALAQRIHATNWSTLPPTARTVAKQCILDFIGVTLAGAREPLADILNADAADLGGHPQAALIGRGTRASVEQAALINGAAGHAHDYDDVHMAMNGHPTVPVAPAVLALAEHHRKGARELLAAFAAGVDAECIVGRYIGPAHYAEGWHATGTLGSFGAAAAAANLLGLDAETTARALGIAATQAAGLKSQFGTMCKPLHAGHAAATGVQAARLAARGFTSRPDILEVAQGFAATQGHGASVERLERALAEASYLPGICFKYHAACYMTHSSIEALRLLARAHRIAPDDVRDVELTVNEGHFGVCNIQEPRTGLEAKFSLRFTAAMALSGRDTSGIETYTDALAREPALVALRDKVRVVAWPTAKAETRARVRVGDRTFETEMNVGIPATDLDAQWERLRAKFRALVDPVLGANVATELADACQRLDDVADLEPFWRAMRGAA